MPLITWLKYQYHTKIFFNINLFSCKNSLYDIFAYFLWVRAVSLTRMLTPHLRTSLNDFSGFDQSLNVSVIASLWVYPSIFRFSRWLEYPIYFLGGIDDKLRVLERSGFSFFSSKYVLIFNHFFFFLKNSMLNAIERTEHKKLRSEFSACFLSRIIFLFFKVSVF